MRPELTTASPANSGARAAGPLGKQVSDRACARAPPVQQHFGRYLQAHLVAPDMTVVRTPLQLHEADYANAASVVATGASPPTADPLLHL